MLEGVLHCSNPECQLEYPIIDGVPLLLPNVRSYISDNLYHLTMRDDLSETTESMLGDSAGPGTLFDVTRQHLSTYAWDGYADLDPDEPQRESCVPGAARRCLEQGVELLAKKEIKGAAIDVGCSVGRTTFELAQHCDGPVLGIDTNFSMLRLAQRIMRDGVVEYPRRRGGIVYDRRSYPAQFDASDRVDFWACDAMALPFPADSFGMAAALQVLDAVASPYRLLESVNAMLQTTGVAILASPYDWSHNATPIEAWIGGHSQRGPGEGASEPLLRSLLTPGAHPQAIDRLKIINENLHFPWHTRIHDRSVMSYDVHLVAIEATGP